MKKNRVEVKTTAVPMFGAMLSLHEMPALVVGGGAVAARKVAHLLECGARVTVVSPGFDAAIVALKKRPGAGTLELIERRYAAGDLKGRRLVFAATDDAALNASICASAERKKIWSNCAAPPEAGTLAIPATVNRGMFALTVSTGGASPALSAYWRKRLEKLAGPEWGALAEVQKTMRVRAHAEIADAEIRRTVLLRVGQPHWAGKVKKLGVSVVKGMMLGLIKEGGRRSKAAATK